MTKSRGGYIPNPDVQPGKARKSNQEARENQFTGGGQRANVGRPQAENPSGPFVDWQEGAAMISRINIDNFISGRILVNNVLTKWEPERGGRVSGKFATGDGYGVGPYGYGGYGE